MTRYVSQTFSAATGSGIVPCDADISVDALRTNLVSTGRCIVTLATSSDTRGGIAAVINSYMQAGLFERWPIIHITTHADGGRLRKLLVAAKAFLRFTRLLLRRRVALVHVHSASNASFWRKSLFMALALAAGRPVIFHLHGGGFMDFYEREASAVGRWLIRGTLRRVDQIVVLTEKWRRQIAKITDNKNVLVIPNPVPIPASAGLDVSRRSASVILFLGRLDREKGVLDLVDALPAICSKVRGVSLQFAGEGDSAMIRTRAEERGVADHVEFLGWVNGEDKGRVLTEATLLALPSYVEGLPMGLLEAMAAGLPVVASAVGGIPDIIEDGVHGFLVPPGDVNALSDALGRLLADEELRIRMGMAGRRRIIERYVPERVLPQIDRLYQSVLTTS